MLSLMEPSEQLLTAMLVAAATVSAALVNARAQVKVAREERRSSKPAQPASKRLRLWLFAGAAVALGLGWSAVARDEARGSDRKFTSAGLTSMFAFGDRADDRGAIVVASLRLRAPMSEEQAVELLHVYGLRPYAVDVRLRGDAETWLALPTGRQPAVSLPRARADAVERVRAQACALEAAAAAAAPAVPAAGTDSLASTPEAAPAAAPMLGDIAVARRRADRLSAEIAVIHGLRVLAAPAAAARVAQDPVIADAEVVRFDPGWELEAPVPSGCEPARLTAS